MSAALLFAVLALTLPLTGPAALDVPVRAVIHSWASPSLTSAMKAATQLGGGWFLFPLGAIVTFGLYREGRRRDAALFVIAVLGANILDEGMKLVFQRVRPDPWFGYPGAHHAWTASRAATRSFVSFCFYFALAEILIRDDWSTPSKLATWTAAALLTLTIGFSSRLPWSALPHRRDRRLHRRHRVDHHDSNRTPQNNQNKKLMATDEHRINRIKQPCLLSDSSPVFICGH